jgi:hypothetical protein
MFKNFIKVDIVECFARVLVPENESLIGTSQRQPADG